MVSNLLLYVLTVVIWGSTWIAINFQLGVVAPEVSLVYRYGLAAVILFAWCHWRQISVRFPLQAHGLFALMGILMFGINYMATYSAQQYISSAFNAVVFSSMMWMNILNARVFFGTRIEPRVIMGAVLGMMGIATLFWPEIKVLDLTDASLIGGLLCLSGALVASFGNMVSQRAQRLRLPVVQSNAWGMLYGTLFLGLVAVTQGQTFNFDYSTGYVSSLLFLTIFGSIIAFGCYLTLLGRIGAHRAGYAVVMFPVVAVALSLLFEGLEMTAQMAGGIGLVLLGNLAVLGGHQRPQARQPTAAKPDCANVQPERG